MPAAPAGHGSKIWDNLFLNFPNLFLNFPPLGDGQAKQKFPESWEVQTLAGNIIEFIQHSAPQFDLWRVLWSDGDRETYTYAKISTFM